MIRLDTTTRKLQVVLAGAVSTNQLPVVVSYSDKTSTTYNGATQTAQTNGTIAVDICAAPASSTIRDVDYINIYNADTSEATITVRCNDNGTLYQLVKTTLKVGSQITYTHSSGWQMMLSDGSIKSGSSFWGGISGTLSDQSDLQSTVESLSPALTYGRNQYTSSGLTWGYYGGNVSLSGGTMSQIANGTLTLTASTTNYVVALKSTGAVSVSTASTNWNDAANYWRLYSVVVGAATVTSYTDSRELAKYTGGGSTGAGSGTVTTVSVDSSNGFSGSVANPTTTPAITLSTGVTGLLKGAAGALVAATNADLPAMSATVGGAVPTPPNDPAKFLNGQGAFVVPSGSGDMVLASAQTITGAKTFKAATLLLRNIADTFSSVFATACTAARTWTFPDKDGTVAMLSDITGTNSGVNTGDETATTIKSKLGITTLSGSNTGDQTLEGLGGVPAVSPSTSGLLTHSGDIVLTGSGKRVTGDFSNATVSNRLMFQSSAVNGNTVVGAIPNGTGIASGFRVNNAVDADNAGFGQLSVSTAAVSITSGKTGTGAYIPLNLVANNVETLRLDISGNSLHLNPAGGLGYGAGAGGTVTQTTSKSTAVTLNRPSGQITMNNAALAAGAEVQFTLNNSVIGVYDGINITLNWTGVYRARVVSVSIGYCAIVLTNQSVASASDPVILNFQVIKGANA